MLTVKASVGKGALNLCFKNNKLVQRIDSNVEYLNL